MQTKRIFSAWSVFGLPYLLYRPPQLASLSFHLRCHLFEGRVFDIGQSLAGLVTGQSGKEQVPQVL
jgi:hypothetical protein